MSNLLWVIAALVVCVAFLYAAYVIEPHWVAKDGARFLTTAEEVDRSGGSVGHRREVRGTLLGDGTIMLGRRSLFRTNTAVFRVRSKSPQVSRGRHQYVLEPVPTDPDGGLLILRVPTKSRLTAALDELAAAAR